VTADGQALVPSAAARAPAGPVPAGSLLVSERLQNGLRRMGEDFASDWKPYCDGPFLMVALAPGSTDDDAWWLTDLATRRVVAGSGHCGEQADWTVSAPAATWEQVIRDGINLGTAFRRNGMRYRDKGDAGAGSITAEHRVAMMSNLLGITSWRPGKGSVPAVASAPGPGGRPPGTALEEDRTPGRDPGSAPPSFSLRGNSGSRPPGLTPRSGSE
jgi:hypothetical protein